MTLDATILVSLPEREDRRTKAMEELSFHQIPFYIWMATKDEDGRRGLVKTMRSLLTFCVESDFNNVLIFEDDLKIVNPGIGEIFSDCMDELPENYDLLYLGPNLSIEPKKYSAHLLRGTGMYSTHAVMYSRAAIEFILEVLDENEAYDITLVKKVQPGMQSYCTFPMLVSQHNTYSDIGKREIDYTKFLEKRFKEKTKDL